MTPPDLADKCAHCLSLGRTPPPLNPMFVELTSDGWRADYLCPLPVCGAGWYTTWNPDVVDVSETPERAA